MKFSKTTAKNKKYLQKQLDMLERVNNEFFSEKYALCLAHGDSSKLTYTRKYDDRKLLEVMKEAGSIICQYKDIENNIRYLLTNT